MQYIADYYDTVKESYSNNAMLWGDNTDYAGLVPQMQQWIKRRHDYIVKNLTVYDITDLLEKSPVNCNAAVGDNGSDGIYTVYGERITDTDNLQQGVYIINRKKVFIKH
jgi:hypothetical protein